MHAPRLSRRTVLAGTAAAAALTTLPALQNRAHAADTAAPVYRWRNAVIGGTGFVTGVLFHPAVRGLAYARTDIGGAYRWDDRAARWIPLIDHIGWDDWNLLGVEALAVDPAHPDRLYLALGTYAQSWAGNGAVLRSEDRGATWTRADLTVKLGANEDGRGTGSGCSSIRATATPCGWERGTTDCSSRRTAAPPGQPSPASRPRPAPPARASPSFSPSDVPSTRGGATPTAPRPTCTAPPTAPPGRPSPGSPPAPPPRCRSGPRTTASPASCT